MPTKKEAQNASDRSLASRNKLKLSTNTRVSTRFARKQLNFDNFATHFLDALLLTEPVVVGDQLREKRILQLTLRANTALARNASRHLKHSHGIYLS